MIGGLPHTSMWQNEPTARVQLALSRRSLHILRGGEACDETLVGLALVGKSTIFLHAQQKNHGRDPHATKAVPRNSSNIPQPLEGKQPHGSSHGARAHLVQD